MKIKPRTLRAFAKWCETHDMSDTFIHAGNPIKGSDFVKLAGGEPPKPVVKPRVVLKPKLEDPVNIDIEKEDADMGQPLLDGDIEEH